MSSRRVATIGALGRTADTVEPVWHTRILASVAKLGLRTEDGIHVVSMSCTVGRQGLVTNIVQGGR